MITFNEWVEEVLLNEAKKNKAKKHVKGDVTGDGKADFKDVLASRMMASGLPKNAAIKKAHHHAKKHEK